jgi:FtsZ-binding cell division protein ZapB
MARPLDHSAGLLPGGKVRSTRPAPWGRIFVAFAFITATACAMLLLGLSWRHELDRRQSVEATANSSQTALRAAQSKLGVLEQRNETLSARTEQLSNRLHKAERHTSRRTSALRSTRNVLRATHMFVAALDGLDGTVAQAVEAEGLLVTEVGSLATHVNGLSQYVRTTHENNLDRSTLNARLRATVRHLVAIRTILASLTEGRDDLAAAAEPLARSENLDVALRSAIARAKKALAR